MIRRATRPSIRVIFRRRKPSGYHLEVRDTGIGLSPDTDVLKAGSLGLQLVMVLLQQLKGRLDLEGGNGTVFLMDFEEYNEAGATIY